MKPKYFLFFFLQYMYVKIKDADITFLEFSTFIATRKAIKNL